jgi:hypothetical protein
MNREQAITLAESKFWEPMSFRDRAVFQINERLLCMTFGVFHEAVEKTIGRPVYTHEFGRNIDGIRNEIMNGAPSPTLEQIINLIPEDKRILIMTPESKGSKP